MSRNLLHACLVVFAAIVIGTILTMDGYELFGRLEGDRAVSKSMERRKAIQGSQYDSSTSKLRPQAPVSSHRPYEGNPIEVEQKKCASKN